MINHTTFATHTVAGNVDKNGNCQGISYASDKGSWKNVVVQGNYKIQLSEEPTPEDVLQTHTLLVETENIVFALKQKRRTFACEVPVIQTEHPQLFILKDNAFMHHFSTNKISPQNTDLMVYVNTKFVYIENFLKNTITSLYNELIKKQCEIERTQLLLATYSLDEFAYAMGQGPGNIAIKSGEIIYLTKCKPVEVQYTQGKI